MVGADFSNSYMFLKLENVLKFYSTRDQILVFELKDTNHCVTITMSHLCLFFSLLLIRFLSCSLFQEHFQSF